MKIRALIIEDEAMARENLQRKLQAGFPDVEVVHSTSSVKDSVKWLKNNSVDVIFMDIELSDGLCFDIFKQVEIKAKVIITTAYSCYAIKAFEDGAIDYLLKPVNNKALERAVSRIHVGEEHANDYTHIENALIPNRPVASEYAYRERFIIHLNDKIIPVKTEDIAYFYSENKNNFLMTRSGISYVIEASLDDISEDLSAKRFYKISRNCIISIEAITTIFKLPGGNYRIQTNPTPPYEITVSRARTKGFLEWLDRSSR